MTTISYKSLLEAKKMLEQYNIPQTYDPLNDLLKFSTIGGMKIVEDRTVPPKIKLSENVNVSDSFRREMDSWLVERFGYQEPFDKNHAYIMGDMIVMRPEMAALISSYI